MDVVCYLYLYIRKHISKILNICLNRGGTVSRVSLMWAKKWAKYLH